MTRSWTDPRTGTRWRLQTVRGAVARLPGRGKGEDAPALVFKSEDASYAVQAWEAGELETLNEERLVELLDSARKADAEPHGNLRDAAGEETGREGVRTRGEGQASPNAMGRESQPHRDPAKD